MQKKFLRKDFKTGQTDAMQQENMNVTAFKAWKKRYICVDHTVPELEPRAGVLQSRVFPGAGALNFPMFQGSYCFL